MSSNISRASLAARFPAPVIPDGHISISSNMANSFNAAENASQSAGTTRLIDVQPNYRLTIAAFCEEVLNVYGTLDAKNSEYASPPAIVAYGIVLLHAHAYHTDLLYRQGPSAFAANIQNDAYLREFFEDLLELPVPPFIANVLQGLARYKSESHASLEIMHSYAGFRFAQDFPNFVPANLFITAHNTLVNAASNAVPPQVVEMWLRQPLLLVGTTTHRVGNFLGAIFDIDGTTYTHLDWFNDRASRIFTPVTQRFHKSRPFFSRIPIETPSFATGIAHFNPYIYGIGVTNANRNKYLEVLSKLADFTKVQFKSTHSLGQILVTNVGSNIVNHFVSEPLLPMHHHSTIAAYDPTAPTYATWQDATHANMAQATQFLQPEPNVDAAHNTAEPPYHENFVPFVPGQADVNASRGTRTDAFSANLYLVSRHTLAVTAAAPPDRPLATWTNPPYQEVSFDPIRHVTPELMFHAPLNAPTSVIYSSAISGLQIQIAEVDAISVPVINTRNPLAQENSQHTSGVVPIGRTPDYASNAPLRYRERGSHAQDSVYAAFSLYDFTVNTIGRLATHIPAAVTTLTGFQFLDGIRFAWQQFSYYTYNSRRTAAQTLQAAGTKVVPVWSPYRTVRSERQGLFNTRQSVGMHMPADSNDAILVHTSLQGTFGQDTRIYGFPHPAAYFK